MVTQPGYFSQMKTFAIKKTQKEKQDPWFSISFSKLGFIGKMFRTRDLSKVANHLLSHFDIKPGDLLVMGDLFSLMTVCTDMTKIKMCSMKVHPKYTKALFQHIGVESSLDGKKQELKEKRFKVS